MNEHDPINLPIDGTLDLHTFQPGDAKRLVPDYLTACRKQGILKVRIVHGKGFGVLQRTVHAILCRIKEVACFYLAEEEQGGWGATVVVLRPPQDEKKQSNAK